MPSFGRNVKLGISQEATYNATWAAPAAATGTWLHHEGFQFDPISQDIRAYFANASPMQKLTEFGRGIKDVKGSFTMFAQKQQLPWIFLQLFGTVATTTVGTGTGTDGGQGQKHIFSPVSSSSTPKSCSFVLQVSSAYQYQLTGCAITKLDMDWSLNQPIKITVSFTGANFVETGLSGTPAYNAVTTGEAWYKYPNTGFTWSINSVTTWGNVKISFERLYADGIDESYEGGSMIRKRLESAGDSPVFKVSGTAQQLYTGNILMPLFSNDTTFEVTYKDIAAPDGTGYHLGINLGKCKSKPSKIVNRGLSLIDEAIEFEAFRDQWVYYTDNDLNVTIVDKQANPATQ